MKSGAYTHSQLPATSLYFNFIAQSKPLSWYAQMLHIISRSDTGSLSLPFSPAWHIWFSHWKLPHQGRFLQQQPHFSPSSCGHLGTALGSRGPRAVWRGPANTSSAQSLPRWVHPLKETDQFHLTGLLLDSKCFSNQKAAQVQKNQLVLILK